MQEALIELLVVVGIVGILAAIAIPIYSNIQARARVGKAQADLRAWCRRSPPLALIVVTFPAP